MATPLFFTGWEHGIATLTTNGGGIAAVLSGTGLSVQSSIKYSGVYSLRGYHSSPAISYVRYNIATTPSAASCRFYIYFTTVPAADCALVYVNPTVGNNLTIRYHQSTGQLALYNQSTFVDIGAVTTGTWYRVDFKVDFSANPNTMAGRLDGGTEQTHSLAQAASTAQYISVGIGTSTTADVYWDDLFVGASADYPIGSGLTCLIKPDADGIHDNAANCIEDDDGNDVGAVTAYDHINSIPPNVDDYLRVGTASAGKYGETTLSDMTAGKTPIGVMGYICYTSATTSGNNAGAVIMDSTTEREIWGKTGAYQDYSDGSTSNLYYKSAIITLTTLNETNVNALKFRFISGDDATPDPYLIDMWAEIAYLETTTKAPSPFQKRTPHVWRKQL